MAASKDSNIPRIVSQRQHLIHAKIQTLSKEGKELMGKDEINRSLKLFKKAFILSCNLSNEGIRKKCLFNLGAAYICVGKPKKALKCLMKSRNHDKDEEDGDLFFNIAAAYDKMQEYDKAVKFYEKAINQYSSEEINSIADALIKLGYCFASVEEFSSAAHSFKLAGHSYLKNERMEDAAMAMREASKYMINSQAFSKTDVLQTLNMCVQSFKGISDKQTLGTLYNHVGLHYAELKCFSEAEKCFTESLNLCSGKQFSIRKMAVLLQNLGAVDNALYQYEKSLRSHAEAADMYGSLGERNEQGQCLCNLAFAYSQLKNFDMAEFYYLQALQAFVDADDPRRQCHVSEGLGATYFCLGNLDQAIHYYKKALTLSGSAKETSDMIRERILEKLTDAIEYKAARQCTDTSSKSVSQKRSNQSPSNCANDDCKSVTSQFHESCDVGHTEQSGQEEDNNEDSDLEELLNGDDHDVEKILQEKDCEKEKTLEDLDQDESLQEEDGAPGETVQAQDKKTTRICTVS
ncbi:tetratricopeptide repeat protein 24-like isoform X2 [Aquarana catesbeiana]|uniref:tetratricopeptide repeat protein 24-like isoform X2 n=1 Tax=Aquarana catesbeiana TaxID=8400 RepID=UPI003CCA262E